MNWYLSVLKKYAVFDGRARRKEYWMFVLFNFIIIAVTETLDITLGTWGIITLLYTLAILVPSIAVSIRRLHDIGKSGWWILITFVPVIGGIWLLVLTCMDGTPGVNNYGPNPKEYADANVG